MPDPAEEKRNARGEQQVGEDGADDGRPHHVEITRLQRHQRDDQLRRVSKRGIEQPTHRVAGARGELFRGQDDQGRDRDDGQRRGKENHRWRHFADVFQDEGDGNENEQPVDGWFHGHKSGSLRFGLRLVHSADHGEKEGRRPAAHQDAGERLDAADQTPLVR